MRQLLITLLLLCFSATAKAAAWPEGRWAGGFDFAGQELTLILDIAKAKKGLAARWSVPERDIIAVPAGLAVDGETLRLTLDQPGLAVGTMTARLQEGFLHGDAAFEPMGSGRVVEGRFLLARMAQLDLGQVQSIAGDYQVNGLGLLKLEAVETPFGPSLYAFAPAGGDEGAVTYPVGTSEFIIGLDPGDATPVAVRFSLDDGSGGIRVEMGGRQVEGIRILSEITLDEVALDAAAVSWMREFAVPGVAVGIIQDGRLIYSHYGGMRAIGGEAPVDAETLFQVGSVSKTFAAALLAKMELEGRIREGDPVNAWLGKDEQLPAAISLEALATHRSGLPRDPFNLRRADGQQLAYDLDDLAAANRNFRLASEPGARFSYSNYGFGLLGHALERAAGRPYAELLEAELLAPLGMMSTVLGVPDTDRLAAHHVGGMPRGPWQWGEVAAQGGIASSLPDMGRWVSFQLGAAAALDPRIVASSQRLRAERDGGGWIGLGWYIDDDARLGRIISHGGEVNGQSAYVALSPAHGLGVVVLANVGGDAAEQVGGKLLAEAVQAAAARQLATPRQADAYYRDARWAEAVWAYRSLVEQAPRYAPARMRLGLSLLQGGEPGAAADMFAGIDDGGRSGAMAHYYRALALAKAGRADEARAAIDAAIAMVGEGPIRSRISEEPVLAALY